MQHDPVSNFIRQAAIKSSIPGENDPAIQEAIRDTYLRRNSTYTPQSEVAKEAIKKDTGEVFGAGVRAGVAGLTTDVKYFNALIDSLTGDDEGVKRNLKAASQAERVAGDITQS